MNDFGLKHLIEYCKFEEEYSQVNIVKVLCIKQINDTILLKLDRINKNDIQHSHIISRVGENDKKIGYINEYIDELEGLHIFNFKSNYNAAHFDKQNILIKKENLACLRILKAIEYKESKEKLEKLFNAYINPNTKFGDRLDFNLIPEIPIHFNKSQKDAIRHALSNNKTTAIIGPPGTGKTTVITEIITNFIRDEKSVLCLATSHVSVDGIIEKIKQEDYKIFPIRLGRSNKIKYTKNTIENIDETIKNEVREYLQNKLSLNYLPDWMKSDLIFTKNTHDETNQNRKCLNENLEKLESKFISRKNQLKTSFLDLNDKSIEELLDTHNHLFPLFSTQIGFNEIFFSEDNRVKKYKKGFDVLIIDEASRLSIPEFVLSAMYAKKIILVGDDKQLQMIIPDYLVKACHNGQIHNVLLKSAFTNMISAKGVETIKMLNTQYRMARSIVKISNNLFYGGKIKTGKNVNKYPNDKYYTRVIWSDIESQEEFDRNLLSYFNMDEIRKTQELCDILINKKNVKEEDITIISFYNAHKIKLKDNISKLINIETVDSFQGKENEIIILNFVRTNKFGHIDDPQRFNVAMTRAKSFLFIIGNKKLYKNNYWVGQGMFNLRTVQTHTGSF